MIERSGFFFGNIVSLTISRALTYELLFVSTFSHRCHHLHIFSSFIQYNSNDYYNDNQSRTSSNDSNGPARKINVDHLIRSDCKVVGVINWNEVIRRTINEVSNIMQILKSLLPDGPLINIQIIVIFLSSNDVKVCWTGNHNGRSYRGVI